MITEDTIKQRITELESQRDQLVIEANKQLTGLSITIMELQKLIESDKEGGE